ncbi:PDZK1-interacting protein 1 [Brienomyrus brachyistius]|uniref:PDZK1-interacting protein 1 n=1 Tax=Brienomyrus brachyistius TaxID=42636 RepID=UPI0020B33A3E|nr:PDZK1-interacting protein 1 [Brienomyrus brachyistius]
MIPLHSLRRVCAARTIISDFGLPQDSLEIMMKATTAVPLLLLLLQGRATAQEDREQRVLKPWMTGIMAVTVFLFLVFVVFLVKKAWCGDSSNEEEAAQGKDYSRTNDSMCNTNLNMVRSDEYDNAFDNIAAEGKGVIITAM